MHTHMNRLTVLWIGFCLTGPISLCLDSFLWSPYVIGQTIIFSCCGLFFFFFFFLFFPRLISAVGDWMSTILRHVVWSYSVNLECRSETCCARLAGNTGRKKVAKNCHLGTIAQFCRAISSQLRHVSTIGKKLANTSSTCADNMVNFGPLTAEICRRVWGTPTNFSGFCVLAALLHGIW